MVSDAAALHAAFQMAGARLRAARVAGYCSAVFVPAALMLVAVLRDPLWRYYTQRSTGPYALAAIGCVALAASGGAWVCVLLIGASRLASRRRLRRLVLRLEPAQKRRLLRGLSADPIDETRGLAAALIREFLGGRTEVAPAPVPSGGFGEPCPVDPFALPLKSRNQHPRRTRREYRARDRVLALFRAGALALFPLAVIGAPLPRFGPGLCLPVPGTRWAIYVYNAVSPERPCLWARTAPVGFSRRNRYWHVTHGETAYSLRVGRSVYEAARSWNSLDRN
jgi:hypothetical protein